MFDLKGKVAIVTGASSGLGADAARAYAQHGADVALLARRKDRLDALAQALREETGRTALAVQCDVSVEADVQRAVAEVLAKFGKTDILLNNAGTASIGSVVSYDRAEWDRVMATNVDGVYLMSKYVIPHMVEAGYGKVVNISSMNALVAETDQNIVRHVYNTSKAAVRGLTMAMAASYAPHNITVNAIGPGLFETEMTAGFFASYVKDWFVSTNPMQRHGKKGELNGTVLYLSSDASSYVTGQLILVDGGQTCV